MGDVKSIVEAWTKEDFTSIENPAPYAWLYEKRGDKFLFEQYKGMLKSVAKSVGVNDFIGRFRAYCESQAAKRGEKFDNVTMFDGQPCQLLCGEYVCDDDGITLVQSGGTETVVCDHPILPTKRLVNIDTGEVKLEIAFKRRSRWSRKVFDKSTLSSNQRIIELAKYGIGVDSENSRDMVRYLSAIENMNYDDIEETKSISRLGWIPDHGFSPYVEDLMFDGDACFQAAFKAVQSCGSFEAWKEIVSQIRKNGTIARVALSASFASALVTPFNLRPFFVHMWGGAGSGKTVGLMLAASVWANPTIGEYIHTFNSTSVGQEMMAGFVNSMPLCIDELQVIKERRDFDQIIYMLAEGVGRTRGSKMGGTQKMQTWGNCVITTGEMPICSGSSGGGAVDRVLEIDCKDEKLFDDPRLVVSVLQQNYGHAGRWFVDWLEQEGNEERARLYFDECYADLSKSGSTARQALAGALVMAADIIVGSCLFGDSVYLSSKDIIPFLSTNDQMDVNARAYDWLLDFVASNPGKFNPESPEVWGMVDSQFAYIIKSVFDIKLLEAGYNPVAFLSWAARNHKIERGSKLTKTKRMRGFENPVRCVWLALQNEFEDVPNSDLPEF